MASGKKKKPKKFVVTSMALHPFPYVVLFIAGDWRAAASAIDEELEDSHDSKRKASDMVFKVLECVENDELTERSLATTTISPKVTDNLIIIWTKSVDPALRTVVHECLHAVMIALDRSGVADNNHETDAYLVEHLFSTCTDAIQRSK